MNYNILCCPYCKNDLVEMCVDMVEHSLCCRGCKRNYRLTNNIPSFVNNHEYYEGKVVTTHKLEKTYTLMSKMNRRFSIVYKRERYYDNMLKKGGSILDLGCGGGNEIFKKYGYVAGIDISMRSVENANKIYDAAVQGDIEYLPFKSNSFDYVVGADVFGHIPINRKASVIAEMSRVLKAQGKIIMIIECDSANMLIKKAKKYPALWNKYFVDADGHVGLELSRNIIERFKKMGYFVTDTRKIYTYIWPLVEYSYRFNNEYSEKSGLLRFIVKLSELLKRNSVIHKVTNCVLGVLSYLFDAIMPLDSAMGIMICCSKKEVVSENGRE